MLIGCRTASITRFEFTFIVPLLTVSREAAIADEFDVTVRDQGGLQC